MLVVLYSAFRESSVVNEPGPTISGKTSGTMDEAPLGVESCLNMVISKIISKPMARTTIEPATANDSTSTPNRANTPSPRK
ncbi:MAG: hypothetical protein BWY95_01671 [Bacteroidetes bacterium ADurb.BinA104]|nr:MAG: hypothetical protein BWY95_01671 [Bacteroidetes bacterium ADurb.BinA104]